jgi:Flp pilus assembly protein CpaB
VTLLQNIEILAVDRRLDAPADHRADGKELRSVTLLVTPEQAAKLDLGQTKGTLHLALHHRLRPAEQGMRLLLVIPKGMRACTIHVPNVAAGVAGLLQPGCKVDVLLTKKDQRAVQTLVQNVEVLAVDQRAEAPADGENDAKKFTSVTLLVTPQQVAKLAKGRTEGTLHLRPAEQGQREAEQARRQPERRAAEQLLWLDPVMAEQLIARGWQLAPGVLVEGRRQPQNPPPALWERLRTWLGW